MYQEYIMGLPLVYLYLIWIQAGFNHAVGLTNDAYIQTRKLGWWEARNKCAQDGYTDLFVPSGEFHVPPDSQIDTHYWVGGAEMSQWRWADNSPLFTLMGQYGIPNVAENRTIHGNSALECYRQCRDAQFGLSGSKCYCFDRVNLGKKFDGTANIESCPGNKDEFCGTQSLISVYKIDIFFFIDGDYRCAYMQRKTFRGQRYIAVVPGACQSSYYGVCVDGDDSRTFLRCEADLCVTCWDSTWSSSNQSCSLVKLTSSRQNDLKYFLRRGVKYWTGLHKQVTKSWISGKEIDDNFEVLTDHTDPGPRCLALTLSPTDWTAHWIPCSVQLQSLCAIKQNKSDDGGSDSSMLPERSALTSPEPHRTSGKPFQATVHTSTVTSETGGNISTGQRVGGDDAIPVQKGESVGTIVGVVMGVITLVAVIVLIILSRRKGKFCFKKLDGKMDHTFAMDNVAYMSPNSLHNDDIIHENSRPGYVGKAANQSPGNDVKKMKSEDIDNYDSTTAVVKNTIDTDYLYNHLGADDDNYDTAGVHRIGNVEDNPYNHTDNRLGVRQSMADNTQDTYNHTERRVGAQQPLADNTQDTYNRIGDNHAEREDDSHDTYNNIGVALGSVESAPGVEQCYNHLMTEVDNDYDTTRPVVDIVQNDTYNHTASLGESQGTDADVNLSVTGCTDENSTDYYNL